jgi:hypothetical protein
MNLIDFGQDAFILNNFVRICLFQFAGRLKEGTTRAGVVPIATNEAVVAACGKQRVFPNKSSL